MVILNPQRIYQHQCGQLMFIWRVKPDNILVFRHITMFEISQIVHGSQEGFIGPITYHCITVTQFQYFSHSIAWEFATN